MFQRIENKLDGLAAQLRTVISMLGRMLNQEAAMADKEANMADTLDEIVADVASETTLEQSVETLLTGIAAQLAAAGQDPAKLAALHATLTQNIANLTAAVTANTPPAPPAPPAPAPGA